MDCACSGVQWCSVSSHTLISLLALLQAKCLSSNAIMHSRETTFRDARHLQSRADGKKNSYETHVKFPEFYATKLHLRQEARRHGGLQINFEHLRCFFLRCTEMPTHERSRFSPLYIFPSINESTAAAGLETASFVSAAQRLSHLATLTAGERALKH